MAKIMAQHPQIETIGSIGSSILGILEVQESSAQYNPSVPSELNSESETLRTKLMPYTTPARQGPTIWHIGALRAPSGPTVWVLWGTRVPYPIGISFFMVFEPKTLLRAFQSWRNRAERQVLGDAWDPSDVPHLPLSRMLSTRKPGMKPN